MSTPIVDKPDLANERAVGRPILPIPTTHTLMFFESNDFLTCSGLFISRLVFDIIFPISDIFELSLTYYNFGMIAFRPKF